MTLKTKEHIAVEWQEYSDNNHPTGHGMVWAYDPAVYGVCIAWWNHDIAQFTHVMTPDKEALECVTHWAWIVFPLGPEGVDGGG